MCKKGGLESINGEDIKGRKIYKYFIMMVEGFSN